MPFLARKHSPPSILPREIVQYPVNGFAIEEIRGGPPASVVIASSIPQRPVSFEKCSETRLLQHVLPIEMDEDAALEQLASDRVVQNSDEIAKMDFGRRTRHPGKRRGMRTSRYFLRKSYSAARSARRNNSRSLRPRAHQFSPLTASSKAEPRRDLSDDDRLKYS